jgi:hypothetical protein
MEAHKPSWAGQPKTQPSSTSGHVNKASLSSCFNYNYELNFQRHDFFFFFDTSNDKTDMELASGFNEESEATTSTKQQQPGPKVPPEDFSKFNFEHAVGRIGPTCHSFGASHIQYNQRGKRFQ